MQQVLWFQEEPRSKRQIKTIWLRSLRLFKIYMNKGGLLL